MDEAGHLPSLLGDLRRLADGGAAAPPLPLEVVVSDGGSTDGTVAIARAAGARVVLGPSGRGAQLALGAQNTRAPLLLFVHADCRLGSAARTEVRRWVADGRSKSTAAHFRFRFQDSGLGPRVVEWGQFVREGAGGLVYGDQGLLVSRELYLAAGGYPDWPLFEDVEIMRRLRERARVVRLDADLPTSGRRYAEGGVWVRRAWRNLKLLRDYRAGVPVDELAARYDRPPAGVRRPGSVLLVFAKAPRPGEVKTRLASTVGPDTAADIYRRLGSLVLDQVAQGEPELFDVVVCHAPDDAYPEMASWLGAPLRTFRHQGPGHLGARMLRCLTWALRGWNQCCVIGTDAPAVDAGLVRRAFQELRDHDVVLGPARDGGYYLIGMKEAVPALFQGMPWSTDQVLQRTLETAGRNGLDVAQLPELVDVDRVEDLPPALSRLVDPRTPPHPAQAR